MKITYNEFMDDLENYDICYYFVRFRFGVFLQNDIDSDDPEYLKLKWDKKGIMVVDGLNLNQSEKKKKWMFVDFRNSQELCEAIEKWAKGYFNSFCKVRKRK